VSLEEGVPRVLRWLVGLCPLFVVFLLLVKCRAFVFAESFRAKGKAWERNGVGSKRVLLAEGWASKKHEPLLVLGCCVVSLCFRLARFSFSAS